MSSNLLASPNFQAVDSNGEPVSGAKAYFYLTGTTTAQDTYQENALSTPHANPVIADSTGAFAPIYLDPEITYKMVLKDASDVTIRTVDPVIALGVKSRALTQAAYDALTPDSTTLYIITT